MIPEAAIEAANEAAKKFFDGKPPRGMRAAIRAALEAAAPHIRADAYRAGHLDAATGVFRPWHQEEAAK